METVVIKTRTKSDVRLLHDFSKRIGAKVIDTEEWIEDMVLGRIIEERLNEPRVDRSEIMKILEQ